MQINARRAEGRQDRLSARHLFGRAVRHDQKPVSLHGTLVREHAVLRNAAAIERCAQGAQAADDDSAFDGGDHHGGKVSKHDDMSDNGNHHENPAKKPAPEAAPEGAALAPKLDPIAYVVESYDLLVGMVSLADDAEMLHVNSGVGQLLNRGFRPLMIGEDGDHGVGFSHLVSPQAE